VNWPKDQRIGTDAFLDRRQTAGGDEFGELGRLAVRFGHDVRENLNPLKRSDELGPLGGKRKWGQYKRGNRCRYQSFHCSLPGNLAFGTTLGAPESVWLTSSLMRACSTHHVGTIVNNNSTRVAAIHRRSTAGERHRPAGHDIAAGVENSPELGGIRPSGRPAAPRFGHEKLDRGVSSPLPHSGRRRRSAGEIIDNLAFVG
jgi:hypothetical protein